MQRLVVNLELLQNKVKNISVEALIRQIKESYMEEDERMYSEEDVKDLLFEALNKKQEECEKCCITLTKDSIVREVLKQFKKK